MYIQAWDLLIMTLLLYTAFSVSRSITGLPDGTLDSLWLLRS